MLDSAWYQAGVRQAHAVNGYMIETLIGYIDKAEVNQVVPKADNGDKSHTLYCQS